MRSERVWVIDDWCWKVSPEVEVFIAVEADLFCPNTFEFAQFLNNMFLLRPSLFAVLQFIGVVGWCHLNYSAVQVVMWLLILAEVAVFLRTKIDFSK